MDSQNNNNPFGEVPLGNTPQSPQPATDFQNSSAPPAADFLSAQNSAVPGLESPAPLQPTAYPSAPQQGTCPAGAQPSAYPSAPQQAAYPAGAQPFAYPSAAQQGTYPAAPEGAFAVAPPITKKPMASLLLWIFSLMGIVCCALSLYINDYFAFAAVAVSLLSMIACGRSMTTKRAGFPMFLSVLGLIGGILLSGVLLLIMSLM